MRYQVHVSTDGAFTPTAATQKALVTGGQSTIITEGLARGTRHFVKVVAVDQQNAVSAASQALDALVSDTAATALAGVRSVQLSAAQVASVTADSVVLASAAPVPAVGTFIASSEANGGLGFLRQVTAVTTTNGATTLSTRRAALTEVFNAVKVSGSFRLDAVPTEVAQASADMNRRQVLTQPDGSSRQSFDWPETGLSYSTDNQTDIRRSTILSARQPAAIGGAISDGFRSSGGTTEPGKWGQISGQTRVEVNEGKAGQDVWTVSITRNDRPGNSSTKVGICKVDVGPVRGGGSGGKPDLVTVTKEAFTSVETDTGNRVTRATQRLRFSAAAGAGTDEPYKVKLTAYLDDLGDGCSGDDPRFFWREKLDIDVTISVTQDTFPTEERTNTPFQGSAGFSIDNRSVTTFSPKLVFDQEVSFGRLQSARISVTASPVVEQTLTLTASAQGTMRKTHTILQPRNFRKAYVTPAGIPIIISGSFKIDLRIEGDVSGKLDATEVLRIGYDEVSFGVEYRNGQFVPVTSATPEYKIRIAGQGNAQANLTLTLLPSLEIKAWEVLTAQAVLALTLMADAGIEGHVVLDAAIDFQSQPQLVTAADADYRLTEATLKAGLAAYLYADFSVWDERLLVYPNTNPDKDDYTTFRRVELMPLQTLMALPQLQAFLPEGAGAVHPTNTQLLKVRATSANQPNPLYTLFPTVLPESFLPWITWTPTKLVAPLGAAQGTFGLEADSDDELGVTWVRMTQPGRYVIRVGGYSQLGSWARQYTEVMVEVFDENQNGILDWWEERYALRGNSGADIAQADPDRDGLSNLQEWQAGTDPNVGGPTLARLTVEPSPATVLQAVRLWVTDAIQSVVSVVWNFGADSAEQTAAVVNGVSAAVSQVFETPGVKSVIATFKNAAGGVVGRLGAQVTVNPAGPAVDSVTPLVAVAGQAATFVVKGRDLPGGLRFQLPGCVGVAELPGGTAAERRFACTFDGNTPAGPVDGTVATSDSPFGAPPLNAFVVTVSQSSLGAVLPATTMRSIATSFDISGENLPTSGITVVPLNDARSTCQAPNNLRANSFGVACELYKLGLQQLQVRAGNQVLGVVTVNVTSNVSGVTWTSPSTTTSGTVRFGETVSFTVLGTNLLVDQTMGFAVERCGVSNTEVGVPGATQRRFSCLFNNVAGAVAGQMPGVVKDAPGGQVLFDGWNVPVEVPPESNQPTFYGNADVPGTTYGQTFIAVQDSVSGLAVYIGDPARPTDSRVDELIGPVDLQLYSVGAGSEATLLRSVRIGTSSTRHSGLSNFRFLTPVAVMPGGKFFLGLKASDAFGIGLTASNASTYDGGAQAFLPEGSSTVSEHASGRDVAFEVLTLTLPLNTSKVPHTGTTDQQCYRAGSDTLVSCTSAAAIALSGAGKQDGMYADVNALSYSEVPNPNGGNFAKTACVKDNITGLVWEGKEASGTRSVNGLYTNLGTSAATDVSGYVAAVNALALCGYSDWRLPMPYELQTLVSYGRVNPTVDTAWFVTTQAGRYWTSTADVYAPSPPSAWFVNFFDGRVYVATRPSNLGVRLVRSGQ